MKCKVYLIQYKNCILCRHKPTGSYRENGGQNISYEENKKNKKMRIFIYKIRNNNLNSL